MNAEQLYEAFVKDNPAQDEAAWSQLLQQHPQEAARLQELRRQYREWQAVIVDLKPSQVQQRLNSNVATESKTVSQWIERLRSQASSTARYEVEEEIGRGGMGVVSRVWDGGLQRTLAMKQIRSQSESAEKSPVILRRFLEEAQITGQLDHPGIVPVHELGLGADGRLFFTMRLVHGENLRTIFEHVHAGREGWTLPRALGVILKVCEAMSYAHDKGVLHRDLKPSNIMVGRYGEVYVMDWGLARVMNQRDTHDLRWSEESTEGADSGDSLVTRDGDIIGTPSYMSPEQALSETDRVGPHSDVYSVGAMLYHLLGVKKYNAPYSPRGANVTAREVLKALRAAAPEPLRDAPPELAAITEKAMARDISQRYRDMQSFASDLRAFLEGRVVRAYETGTWAELRKWFLRNPSLTAALSGGVLALSGGLIFSVYFATESRANEEKALNANSVLDQQNKILQEANRDARLRAVIQELNRFREETGDRDAVQALSESTASWWLARAKRLVAGVAAEPGHPETWVPGLADVESKLAELRRDPSVGPYGPVEARLDFDTHPERGRITELERELGQIRPVELTNLEAFSAKVQWMARMLGEESWPEPASARAELATALVEEDWDALRKQAFACVENSNGRIYGREVQALLLMERALEVAPEDAQAPCTFSLAMIRAYNGQTAAALATAVSMQDRFVGNEPPWLSNGVNQVRNYVAEWTGEARNLRRDEWQRWKAEQQATTDNLESIIAGKELPIQRRLESLRAECSQRRTWTFPSSDQQWWHDTLTDTTARMRHLADSIAAAEMSLQTEHAKARWSEALSAIASSPRYSGCRWPNGAPLTPQLGLLPLGENPVTGLWEFVHTQSGKEPGMDANGAILWDELGRLALGPDTGIIFVLLPGGGISLNTPFPATNLFPEDPTTVIQLAPYFLARHELTQEQWDRLSGKPWWHAAAIGDMKPVTMVSWQDAEELWSETLGWLALPSGAQWEFACRAGTTTPWWTGVEPFSLLGLENVRLPNAPVNPLRAAGQGQPNPLGMHDMHGNVWEWCADAFPLEYERPELKYRQGDGLRNRKLSAHRQFRGGSNSYGPDLARSGYFSSLTFTHRVGDLGLRVMRPVMP